MSFFIPKDSTFFVYLKSSGQNVLAISQVLTTVSKSFTNLPAFSRKAKKIEHQADEGTHEVARYLNRTFITPFDREDIYHLALEVDDIVDLIEDVIHNFYLYHFSRRSKGLDKFSKLIYEDAVYLAKLFSCLEDKKKFGQAQECIIKIHEIEDRGDALYDEVLVRMFAEIEKPAELIKTKSIYDRLEEVVDKFQRVSDIIEGVIVKYS